MNDVATTAEDKRDRLAIFDWNGTLFDDMEATHIATNACLESAGRGLYLLIASRAW